MSSYYGYRLGSRYAYSTINKDNEKNSFKKGNVTGMSKQARELRKLRAWLGLTQEDVDLKVGISHANKRGHGSINNSGSDINSIFETTAGRSQMSERSKNTNTSTFIASTAFTIGSCYQVVSNKSIIKHIRAGEKYAVQSVCESGDDPEFGYTFRYLGKQGIHHVFREICCGWGRTYTDAQLVGKEVVEVSEAEVRRLRKSLMQAEVRF